MGEKNQMAADSHLHNNRFQIIFLLEAMSYFKVEIF
jgi:hypothetical protein